MKKLVVLIIALSMAIGGCASMGGGKDEEKKIEVVTDNLEKMEGKIIPQETSCFLAAIRKWYHQVSCRKGN